MKVHRHQLVRTSKHGFAASVAVFVVTAVAGCGPIAFQDSAGFAIAGTPPEPVAAAPQPTTEVRDNRVVINEKVQFEFDSAEIRPASKNVLNEVAATIKANPQIKALELQGHASAEGTDEHNQELSEDRAKAVMRYLTRQGVDASKLSSRGFGESQPIASNDTEEGRVKNRRVEFAITEQEITQQRVEITPEGEERVVDEQTISG